MPRIAPCPKCSAKLRLPEKTAGKTIRCPKCGAGLKVGKTPSPQKPASPASAITEVPGTPPRAADEPEQPDDDLWDDVADDSGHQEEAWTGDWNADPWNSGGGNDSPDHMFGQDFTAEIEAYGMSAEVASDETSTGKGSHDASSPLYMGLPVRTSVMDHDSYKQSELGQKIPGMGVASAVGQFLASGKGIILMVILLCLVGVGWPLMNLYNQWMVDSGAASGDEEQMARTGTNILRLAQGGRDLAEAESKEEAREIVRNARSDIATNNQQYDQLIAERDRKPTEIRDGRDNPPAAPERNNDAAAPIRPKNVKNRRLDRDGNEIITADPPATAIVGGEFVIRFDVKLMDMEYRISSRESDPQGEWKKPRTTLDSAGSGPALPVDAAVTEYQDVIYLGDETFRQLQKLKPPILVRLGRERMRIADFDEFQTSVKVERMQLDRAWHSVSEPLVVLNGDADENLDYYTNGRPLFQDSELFSWRPTPEETGEKLLQLRWNEQNSPYHGTVDIEVAVMTPEQQTEANLARLEAQLAEIPTPWSPFELPAEARTVDETPPLKVSPEVQRMIALPDSRTAPVSVVEISPSDAEGKLTTNLTSEDSTPVEIALEPGTGVPLLSLPVSAATELLKPYDAGPQTPALPVEASTPFVRLRSTKRWIPAPDDEASTESFGFVQRCFPLEGDGEFLFLADPHHLLRIDASNGTVLEGFISDARMTDLAMCSKGPVLLVRPQRMQISATTGNAIPVAASKQSIRDIEWPQLVLLNARTLQPVSSWALLADAIAANPENAIAWVACSGFVATLDLNGGHVKDLRSLPKLSNAGSFGRYAARMQYLPKSRQLTVQLASGVCDLLQFDTSTGTLRQLSTDALRVPSGQLQPQLNSPAALVSMNGFLAFTHPRDPDGYTPLLRHPPAEKAPVVAVDPATHSVLSVYRTKVGSHSRPAATLYAGPVSLGLLEDLANAESVCTLSSGGFLVTTPAQQIFVQVETKSRHWPFEYPAQKSWTISSDEVTPVSPESPEMMVKHRPTDLSLSISASNRVVGWAEDGSSWITYQVAGRRKVSLHRFDPASGTETHRLILPYKDASIRVMNCPAGVLVVSGTQKRFELYSTTDLHPIWRYNDPSVTSMLCSQYHDRIAVATHTDLALLNATTGEIETRISRLELVRLDPADSLVYQALIPTRDPDLFYPGREMPGQE
ncbi:MAG: hypothetical protein KDA96_12085, partial [Planctomycetaceae bacterium]|nr:hypothetical protein [Planctomycetaceae bacterium]